MELTENLKKKLGGAQTEEEVKEISFDSCKRGFGATFTFEGTGETVLALSFKSLEQAKEYLDDKVAEWEPIKTVDEILQETMAQQKNNKKQELLERLQHKWQQKDDIAVSSSNAYSQSSNYPIEQALSESDDDALTTYYQYSGSDTQKTTRQDDLAQHLDKIAADDMAQQEKINRLQHKQALLEKLQHKWGHQENSKRTPIVQNNDSEAAAYSKVEALSDDDDEFSAYYHHLFTSDEQKTEQNEQNNTTQNFREQ